MFIGFNEKWKWAHIGKEVGENVAQGKAEVGILFCWSGTGVCNAANRIKGVGLHFAGMLRQPGLPGNGIMQMFCA